MAWLVGAEPPVPHAGVRAHAPSTPARSRWRAARVQFVDASPQEALDLAREAAGELDVRIGGGPTVVRDFLAADLIDSLHVVLVPILLGRGVRLWTA